MSVESSIRGIHGGAGGASGFVRTCLLCLASSVMLALAFPPFDWWFLAFVVPAPLTIAALGARRTSHVVVAALITQLVIWLWLLRWIIPVTGVGYPFLGLYMSIYPALYAWIIRRISRHHVMRRWPMTLTVPLVWTGIEFLRGQVACDGYPWYLLAHPLIAWPALAQSADLFGAYFISFLAAAPAGFIAGVATNLQSMVDSPVVVDPIARARFVITIAVALVVIMTGNLVYGAWRLAQRGPLSAGPSILAIQTNLPQDNKMVWTTELQARDFSTFCRQTIEAHQRLTSEGKRIDLVAWPETMLPGFGLEPQTIAYMTEHQYLPGDLFSSELQSLKRSLGTPMLVGSPAFLGLRVVGQRYQWDKQYNSAYLVTGDPPYQRYDKSFLTPYGETMPYISEWPWLEQKMLDFGAHGMRFDLDSNPEIRLLKLKVPSTGAQTQAATTSDTHAAETMTYSLATPICFEDTVAPVCRRMVYEGGRKRVDVLVNMSNDGWFNASHGDRRLHAQIARFRCIENRVPMVRCVNTGVSVSIDSCGRLVAAVGPGRYGVSGQAGALLAQPTLDSRATLYGRVGEVFPTTCLVATILLLVWTYLPGSKGASS